MTNLGKDIELTYMGHSTFRIKSPSGKIVILDPWVDGNPMCPESLKKLDKVDILAITHAHFDHIGDAVRIGNEFQPKVVGIYETCVWLNNKGVQNILPMNKGGTQEVDGIKFTMVHADHSCGIQEEDGTITYGGEAVGYVIEFENGFKVYHAGDTAVFSDMKLIAEIYKPELIMIPIGDLFTMSPLEASYACRFLAPKYVIPMHYGTFPLLTGTPEQLINLTQDIEGIEIIELKPGETLI
ncbi:MAG: metal-dependent hydrolase [Thermodesulfobacteriales bacterium]